MINDTQLNKLYENNSKDKETIRLKYTDLLNNDVNDYVELLSKSQLKRIEKSKKIGKGVDLTFTQKQLQKIKQTDTEKKINNSIVEKKEPSSDEISIIGKEISENKKLNYLLKLVYERYVEPTLKYKKTYNKGIEFLLLLPMMNKKFIKSIPDLSRLTDKQIERFVDGLLKKKVGTGILGDVFSSIKNVVVKSVSTTIRILKNTTVKFVNNLASKYTPLKIIETLGMIAVGIITENPLILEKVVGEVIVNMGTSITSAFKDSIKQELMGTPLEIIAPVIDVINPENIEKGISIVNDIQGLL